MKKLILMISLTALIFTGCKKKEDPAPSNNNNTTPSGVLVCKVNGKAWQSDAASKMTTFVGDPTKSTEVVLEADTMNIIGIQIKNNDTSAILMSVVLKAGRIGTYTSSSVVNGFYVAGTEINDLLTSALGYTSSTSFEITKFDAATKKFSGKFSITMTGSSASFPNYTVTEGTFTDVVID